MIYKYVPSSLINFAHHFLKLLNLTWEGMLLKYNLINIHNYEVHCPD